MTFSAPTDWKRVPLGDLARAISDRNRDGVDAPVLSVTKYDGFVPSLEYFKKRIFSKDVANYKLVQRGDFAYATIHLDEGSIDLLERFEIGLISPMYTVFRPNRSKVDLRFLRYLLKSEAYIALYGTIGRGSINRRRSIPFSDLAGVAITYPPLPEQKKIAEILGSVDEAIQATQAVIDQTRKVKQGLLQQLLTRGIGHTRFKQTEIGEIPESWRALQLGSLLESIDAGWSPTCSDHPPCQGQWGVLKVSAVTTGNFLEQESKTLPDSLSPRPNIRVKHGDVLVARANGVAELVGRAAMVLREPEAPLMLSDKTLRLVPMPSKLVATFLLMQLQSPSIREQIRRSWGGSSGQKNISQATIRSFTVGVPPIQEQEQISSAWTSLASNLERESETLVQLGETKRGLMQDLLTGRVRVAA